jgi:hypothetical protein
MMTEELGHHLTQFDIVVYQQECGLFAGAIHEGGCHRAAATGGVTSHGRGRNFDPSASRL